MGDDSKMRIVTSESVARPVVPRPRSLRVLVLDEWVPYPPDTGKRIRTWHLLRRLASRHEIALLCYGDSGDEAAAALRAAGISLHTVGPLPNLGTWRLYLSLAVNLFSRYPYSVSKHYSRGFENCLRRILGDKQFDLVHCEWTPYARFLRAANGLPSLIMAHNVESQIWFRRAEHSPNILHRSFFALQAQKMEAFEQAHLRNAEVVATVTSLDAGQVARWGARSVALVENGVDLEEFRPAEGPPVAPELLYLGSLDAFQNLDAVLYLIEEIMPIIAARVPQVSLRIVGRRPPAALQRKVARYPWATLVGEVADVRPHVARAALVVVPLRIGGGSRIKILEAMAMKKTVVSTSVGAEGLAVEDGKHLGIADTPQVFADRVVELLDSPQERLRLGINGRRLVEERYSWDRIAEALESAWFTACRLPCPSGASANITGEGGHTGS